MHEPERIAGPRGAKPVEESDALPGLEGLEPLPGLDEGTGAEGGTTPSPVAGIPVGLLDDIAQPLWKVTKPLVGLLPGPAKIGALGVGAAASLVHSYNQLAPFRNAPPPEKRAP